MLRDSLSEVERRQKSRIIMDKIFCHPRYQEADNVLAYMDFRGEVMTGSLLENAWQSGKAVYIPRVEKKEMKFYRIHSQKEVTEGTFGIKEPKTGCASLEISCKNISRTLAIVPGVAFDRKGNRIGYGGGYYDKYFAENPGIYRLAIAYAVQIVPEIAVEKTDIKMDCMITES